MGRGRATLTIGDIERIFRRRGWRYEMQNGRLISRFDGVPMLLGIEEDHQVVVIVVPLYIAGANRHASQAHEREVDTFLAAVNYEVQVGAFVRDTRTGDIYYTVGIPTSNGHIDDETLAEGIALAVNTVQALGPIVDGLVKGTVTLNAALDSLQRAVNDARRQSA
jgi:hypothetical protein